MGKKQEVFRECVAGIIINKDKKILMCEHIWIDNAWQFPQGGVDEGESYDKAILRELKEELGTGKFKIVKKMEEKLTYIIPTSQRRNTDFMGQNQTFYLMYFDGEDSDIDFETHEKAEFKNFKWVTPDVPVDEVIYFKKINYFNALNFFKEDIENFDYKKVK